MSLQSTLLETQAKEQYEKGKYLEAYQLLQEAIEIDGENLSLLENALYLARDYLRLPDDIIGIANQMLAIDVEHVAALIQRGWAYYDTQHISEALEDFEKAMLLTEDQEDMLYIRSGRGLCYYFINKYEEAVIDLKAGIAVYDKWAVGFAYLGWSLYYLKSFTEGKEYLTKAIEMSEGEYPFANGGRGLINYELEIYDEAIEDLTLGLAENVNWAQGYATRGWSYYEIPYYQDKLALALADFNTALEKSEEPYMFALAGRGLLHYDKNMYEKAIADLELALTENQHWTKGYAILAWSFLENGEAEKAIEIFDKSIELADGNYPFAKGGRGIAYYELEKYTEAIADLEDTLLTNDEWSRGYATIGWCKYELAKTDEDYQSAVVDFDKALELADNKYVYAKGGRALVYHELREYEKAIVDLDDTFLEDQSWAKGYAIRGWCKFELAEKDEDYSKAITDLNKALALADGNYTYAQSGRAMCYYYMDKTDEALADLLVVMPEYPNWIAGHRALGYCYYEKKEYEKAMVEYEKILADKPEDWGAHSRKGLVYSALKEHKKAIKEYKVAIEFGGNSCVKGNLAEMYRLGNGMAFPKHKKAFQLYEAAYIEQDETRTCGCITAPLIDCYYRGIGTVIDIPKAKKLLLHGIEIENDSSYFAYLLGYFHATGELMERDVPKAIELLKKAQKKIAEDRLGWYNLYVLYTEIGDDTGAKEAKALASETSLDLADEFIVDVERELKAKTPKLIYPFK